MTWDIIDSDVNDDSPRFEPSSFDVVGNPDGGDEDIGLRNLSG